MKFLSDKLICFFKGHVWAVILMGCDGVDKRYCTRCGIIENIKENKNG